MRGVVALLVGALLISQARAYDIKLDGATWYPQLASLCDAARFGSRMTAEPICASLAEIIAKAQAEEKAKAAAENPPANK